MELITVIAVVSCGLRRHLQILVIRYVQYRYWILICLAFAPYGDDETLLMKEKNRGVYRT